MYVHFLRVLYLENHLVTLDFIDIFPLKMAVFITKHK